MRRAALEGIKRPPAQWEVPEVGPTVMSDPIWTPLLVVPSQVPELIGPHRKNFSVRSSCRCR